MVFLGAIAGTLAGILTGLTPGIHVNTVTALALAGSAICAPLGLEYTTLLTFVCSLAISHTFFDVVPGLFLGVPGDETFALLPGHRMVRRGEGQVAVQLSIAGSGIGLALGIAAMVAQLKFGNLVGTIERLINPAMFWILLAVALILILSERHRFRALFAFLASGMLGIVVFGSTLVAGGSSAAVNVLFPSLVGLFGVAGLLFAITTNGGTLKPVQAGDVARFRTRGIAWPGIRGGFAGLLVGLLPGLGGANAATLLMLVERRKSNREEEDRAYLVTTSSLNTAEALFAIAALYLIGRSRSGASIAIERILGGIVNEADILLITSVMMGAGVMASVILWRLGPLLAKSIQQVDSVSLNVAVIGFLTVLTFALLRIGGVAILICATVVGLVPLLCNVRRAQLMGFFLVPTMLYFSGHQNMLIDTLSIGSRTAPLLVPDSLLQIMLAVFAAVGASALSYMLASRRRQIFRRFPIARRFGIASGVVGAVLILVLAIAGGAYPSDPDLARAEDPVSAVPGRIVRVIDADTVEISSYCRRFRVRLKGVDAPELGTDRGDRARDWAIAAFEGQKVTLHPVGVDVYGRILGFVDLEGGTRINDEVIRLGHASPMGEYIPRTIAKPSLSIPPATNTDTSFSGLVPVSEDKAIPWDDNGDGRVSCEEARRHGIAPVYRGDPAYPYMRDADGDGVVCE